MEFIKVRPLTMLYDWHRDSLQKIEDMTAAILVRVAGECGEDAAAKVAQWAFIPMPKPGLESTTQLTKAMVLSKGFRASQIEMKGPLPDDTLEAMRDSYVSALKFVHKSNPHPECKKAMTSFANDPQLFAVESGQLACQCAIDIPLGTLDESARRTSTLAVVRKLVAMETAFVSVTETMDFFEGTFINPVNVGGEFVDTIHRLTSTNTLLDYRMRLNVALNLLGMTYFDPQGFDLKTYKFESLPDDTALQTDQQRMLCRYLKAPEPVFVKMDRDTMVARLAKSSQPLDREVIELVYAVVLELYSQITEDNSVAFAVRLPPKFVSDSIQYLCADNVMYNKLREYLPTLPVAGASKRSAVPTSDVAKGESPAKISKVVPKQNVYAFVDPDHKEVKRVELDGFRAIQKALGNVHFTTAPGGPAMTKLHDCACLYVLEDIEEAKQRNASVTLWSLQCDVSAEPMHLYGRAAFCWIDEDTGNDIEPSDKDVATLKQMIVWS